MPDIFVLSERDIKEINFAKLYAMDFAHGTAGHNRLMLIANLAAALEARDVQIVSHEAGDAEAASCQVVAQFVEEDERADDDEEVDETHAAWWWASVMAGRTTLGPVQTRGRRR